MSRLYEKLDEYGKSNIYPYHMPGHKRRKTGDFPQKILGIDITEIDGFDNLHQPQEILRELQEKAARLYGAEESFYMVNGSTGGILSAISAALPEGGHLLMARNCHKSAYHAAYLRNLTVSYLYPPVLEEYDICGAVLPEQVEEALNQEKDIGAVLVVSPTYEGRIADIEAIAEAVHAKGIPLIVDEAHGAHLGFEKHFAENSCTRRADIVIHSVHKTLPSMTQTALLHVNGNRINRELLKRFLHIYQSSSPSYVLMASIDNAMDWIERQGKNAFAVFAERYLEMCKKLSMCRHLQFVWPQQGRQDIGKLVISCKRAGTNSSDTGLSEKKEPAEDKKISVRDKELSGQKIYDILLKDYQLQLEMAAGSYCLAMFTAADGPEAYSRMAEALLSLDARIDAGEFTEENDGNTSKASAESLKFAAGAEQDVIPLYQAWDRAAELLPLEEAVGRYAGEFVNLYPPGIPILVPGERISRERCREIMRYLKQGLNVQGIERQRDVYLVRVLF